MDFRRVDNKRGTRNKRDTSKGNREITYILSLRDIVAIAIVVDLEKLQKWRFPVAYTCCIGRGPWSPSESGSAPAFARTKHSSKYNSSTTSTTMLIRTTTLPSDGDILQEGFSRCWAIYGTSHSDNITSVPTVEKENRFLASSYLSQSQLSYTSHEESSFS